MYFSFFTEETSQENESDEDAGVMKTNTKQMTFYHCLFGGYGFVLFTILPRSKFLPNFVN